MEEKKIGVITHYFGHISVGIIELTAPLKIGDAIRIKGAHDDFIQKVETMEIEHKKIEEAKAGEQVGIKVIQKVHPNDEVYLVTE